LKINKIKERKRKGNEIKENKMKKLAGGEMRGEKTQGE
jgi:hypothetical protein